MKLHTWIKKHFLPFYHQWNQPQYSGYKLLFEYEINHKLSRDKTHPITYFKHSCESLGIDLKQPLTMDHIIQISNKSCTDYVNELKEKQKSHPVLTYLSASQSSQSSGVK